ncbi:NAD-binding protein [Rickenella mellea]|uniref:NAD-binding protein n=1 Tax=Rickenella mellea TaxID=50990 RepID=A0A4Y7QKT5_9AGAM|nr:NAD-binding protein [Rickenella mellea]
MAQKVVVCGAGFIGSHITRTLARNVPAYPHKRRVQLTSRTPQALFETLNKDLPPDNLLPPFPADVTQPTSLGRAFEGASVVVSLVGVLYGTQKSFEDIQWHGAENVAKAAKEAGAKLIHFSAIGANKHSKISYARTKGLGEEAALSTCPDATVIRPSLVFGPGDGFFARFSKLAKFMPFLPVFGGGTSRFQPVYVGDIARVVEICSRTEDLAVRQLTDGKIIEAGGPQVYTYKEMMKLVLEYSNLTRPIMSLPFASGMIQGFFLEKLPPNLFTVSRDQIEQLKYDNVVDRNPSPNYVSFPELLEKFDGDARTPLRKILPQYL